MNKGEDTLENKEFRLIIYTLCLEYFEDIPDDKFVGGFCGGICYSVCKYFNIRDSYVLSHFLHLYNYPELINYEPDVWFDSMYWFNPKDKTVRLNILNEIIYKMQ